MRPLISRYTETLGQDPADALVAGGNFTAFAAITAFTAIASPVRRQILDLLATGERPVNALASRFAMSRPAISQHLRILLTAGLVAETRQGRENLYRLVPENLAPVRDWIRHYERFWDNHPGRL